MRVEGWTEAKHPHANEPVYLAPDSAITDQDVARAWLESSGPEIGVGVLMTDEGSLALAKLTRAHIGEHVAFVINGRVVSMPRIVGEISRRALIHGDFTEEQAREIAEALNQE